AVVGTGVADVADHLSTIDVPAHGDTAGEAREVAVTQDRAARCAQPHLATAELVELLLGGAVRDVLHEYVPDAGRHLDVSGICPYDLGICRSDDGSAVGHGHTDVAVVEIYALADAVAVGARSARQVRVGLR